MNPVLRGSAAHVCGESLSAPQLRDEDEHHLRRVLRIRASDIVTVSDGAGRWVVARLGPTGLEVGSDPTDEPAPPYTAVFSAIPKGDRAEWLVQKLTEVGVVSMGFIDCARSVVHWDEARTRKQGERLRRVAREAAMQSRRVWLPELLDPVPYATIARNARCAVAEPDGTDVLGVEIDTVLVGPEGGFTDDELEIAALRVCLSRNVLRIDTAAVAAAIMLTLRHEDQ